MSASKKLALFLALFLCTTGVWADTDPDFVAHDKATSEAIDIAIIAADKGWDVETTRQHMADQNRFGALQDQIEAQFPTKFSGARFAKTPGGKSYLQFKGAVPTAAKSLVAESGLNVGLTGGRKYSATELQDRSIAVVTFFGDAGYPQVASAVLANGTIEVVVSGAVGSRGSAFPNSSRTV